MEKCLHGGQLLKYANVVDLLLHDEPPPAAQSKKWRSYAGTKPGSSRKNSNAETRMVQQQTAQLSMTETDSQTYTANSFDSTHGDAVVSEYSQLTGDEELVAASSTFAGPVHATPLRRPTLRSPNKLPVTAKVVTWIDDPDSAARSPSPTLGSTEVLAPPPPQSLHSSAPGALKGGADRTAMLLSVIQRNRTLLMARFQRIDKYDRVLFVHMCMRDSMYSIPPLPNAHLTRSRTNVLPATAFRAILVASLGPLDDTEYQALVHGPAQLSLPHEVDYVVFFSNLLDDSTDTCNVLTQLKQLDFGVIKAALTERCDRDGLLVMTRDLGTHEIRHAARSHPSASITDPRLGVF